MYSPELRDRKHGASCAPMSRLPIAILIGLIGFCAYLGVVVALADHVLTLHWTVQVAYFLLAGVLWALPAHYLMLWAARR